MVKIVEEVAPGCILRLLKGEKEWKTHIVGFVDDKDTMSTHHIQK